MATTQVATALIADASVTSTKLASGAAAANIAAASITPSQLSQPLTQGTAQNSTSGTSIDFTGIPSWAKRITVMFNGVSTNGTSNIQVQLGTSGGFDTTGYSVGSTTLGTGSTASTNYTTGFGFYHDVQTAAAVNHGHLIFTNVSAFNWVGSGLMGLSNTPRTITVGGNKTMSTYVDRVRITTVTGTDTFDAGSINILYE